MKFIKNLILVLFILFTSTSFAVNKKYHQDISLIKSAFKQLDKKVIATLISYPLGREFPIPAIQNEAELVNRFDEVFDKKFTEQIANSDLDKDWSMMGWRGIMFSNGELWLDSSNKIRSITYQSSKEKQIRARLIEKQKQTLHQSLRVYKQPVLEWKTSKFHIRIDDLGDYNYRYSSWSINKQTRDKPDLILENGKMVFEGSGGNHYYSFSNGKYIYRCYVSVLGDNKSSLGKLDIFNGEEHILSDDVLEVLSH
jgi:hypothetical protein